MGAVTEEMELLETSGWLEKERVTKRLRTLGGVDEPLANEDQVQLKHLDDEQRGLVLKMLRFYRALLKSKGDCPPNPTTGVVRHVGTQGNELIRLKRRRHSATK